MPLARFSMTLQGFYGFFGLISHSCLFRLCTVILRGFACFAYVLGLFVLFVLLASLCSFALPPNAVQAQAIKHGFGWQRDCRTNLTPL